MPRDLPLGEKHLNLKASCALARGRDREVHLVDGHPELLIKVVFPPNFRKYYSPVKRFIDRLFPSRIYRVLFRESDCYIRTKIAQLNSPGPFPLSEFHGLMITNLGLASIVEKISDEQGNIGPTLQEIYNSGKFDELHLKCLNEFACRLLDLNIVASDLSPHNIVLGFRNGKKEFVLVDGAEDINLIPIRKWSRLLNIRSLNNQLQKLGERVHLEWNVRSREFRIPESKERTAG